MHPKITTSRRRRRGEDHDDTAVDGGPDSSSSSGSGVGSSSSVFKCCRHVTAGGERECTVLLTGSHLVVRYVEDSDGGGGVDVDDAECCATTCETRTQPERRRGNARHAAGSTSACGNDRRVESYLSRRSSSSSSSSMCTYSPGEREYLASIQERAREHLGLLSDDNDNDDDDDDGGDEDNDDGAVDPDGNNDNSRPGNGRHRRPMTFSPEIDIDRDYLAAIEERASQHLRLLSFDDDEHDAAADPKGEGEEGDSSGDCCEERELRLRLEAVRERADEYLSLLPDDSYDRRERERVRGCRCSHSGMTSSSPRESSSSSARTTGGCAVPSVGGSGSRRRRQQRTLVWPLEDACEVYLRQRRVVDCALEIFGGGPPRPSPETYSSSSDGDGDDDCKERLPSPLEGCERGRRQRVLPPLGSESLFLSFEQPSDDRRRLRRCSHCRSDGSRRTEEGMMAEDIARCRRDRFLSELVSFAPHLILNEPPARKPSSAIITTAATPAPTVIALETVTEEWRSGRMSNHEYLLRLNASAGRSVHDPSNYPVFPWVLSNYHAPMGDLDLTDPRNYRDLSRPMGALDRRRLREVFLRKYNALGGVKRGLVGPVGGTTGDDNDGCSSVVSFSSSSSSSTTVTTAAAAVAGREASTRKTSSAMIPPFMYGSHYSSRGGVVLHYLVRLHPFAGLHRQLQGGRFDVADRLFDSVPRTWDMCSRTSLTEVKELTPEWYSDPRFLRNSNRFNLGTRNADGRRVGDVVLPPWAGGSAETFVAIMREALEGDVVSSTLHHWIDLIFGYKQRGLEAHQANNVFYHTTYYGADELGQIRDESLRKQIEMQIADFGRTPTQIFRRPHPKRRMTISPFVSGSEEKEHVLVDTSPYLPLQERTPPNSTTGRTVAFHGRTIDDTIDLSQGSTPTGSWLDGNVEDFKRSSSSRYAQRLPWTDTDECSSIASF